MFKKIIKKIQIIMKVKESKGILEYCYGGFNFKSIGGGFCSPDVFLRNQGLLPQKKKSPSEIDEERIRTQILDNLNKKYGGIINFTVK